MDFYIAVFWSRSEAFSFANLLKKQNISTALVQTPKEAGKTCGLSVKFAESYMGIAKKSVEFGRYNSFGGFLFYKFDNGRWIYCKK